MLLLLLLLPSTPPLLTATTSAAAVQSHRAFKPRVDARDKRYDESAESDESTDRSAPSFAVKVVVIVDVVIVDVVITDVVIADVVITDVIITDVIIADVAIADVAIADVAIATVITTITAAGALLTLPPSQDCSIHLPSAHPSLAPSPAFLW